MLVNGLTAQSYFQQELSYKIDVVLNDKAKTLTANETIVYKNNAPQTLDFIWFHIWPNAYANQNTALFKQINNDPSRKEKLKNVVYGNITGLAFKVDGKLAKVEAHSNPTYTDIVKVMLPTPLASGASCTITTPFVTKLPSYFSRSGFADGEFMACQWYPKPAVYDINGWNEFPYLDMGEFYSEYANFDVNITVPKDYVVSATGVLNTKEEAEAYKKIGTANTQNRGSFIKYTPTTKTPTKTLQFKAENVPDFAFFADKKYVIQYKKLTLPSGKSVDAFAYFYPKKKSVWTNSIDYVVNATEKYSEYIGDYIYPTVQAVEGPKNNASGGMEYPMVTLITSPDANPASLDAVIAHEVGHNWFMSIFGSNERVHGWMDEGLNTYFQLLYEGEKYKDISMFGGQIPAEIKKLPVDEFMAIIYRVLGDTDMKLPIETHSADFKNSDDYGMTIYMKTAVWMNLVENEIGKDNIRKGFKLYYDKWKLKHPQPADFKACMEEAAGRNLDELFALLNKADNIVKKITE
jgi:hypothetical protein